MEFYLEPARNIPVLATTEVLVVGGGPSGIAAAMSAAREGAATMLIERFGCFGGMMTTAGVESIAWWRHENTVESGGLAREIEETAKLMGRPALSRNRIVRLLTPSVSNWLRMQCLNRQVCAAYYTLPPLMLSSRAIIYSA